MLIDHAALLHDPKPQFSFFFVIFVVFAVNVFSH